MPLFLAKHNNNVLDFVLRGKKDHIFTLGGLQGSLKILKLGGGSKSKPQKINQNSKKDHFFGANLVKLSSNYLNLFSILKFIVLSGAFQDVFSRNTFIPEFKGSNSRGVYIRPIFGKLKVYGS